MQGKGRSWIAWRKRQRTLRARAGESLGNVLITEGSEAALTTEDGENLTTEAEG